MIAWRPLSPVPAGGPRQLPPFAVEEGFTDVARKTKTLRPFAVQEVAPESHWFVELAIFIAAAVLLTSGIRIFLAQPFYIPSESMVPQLEINDRIVVNKLAYKLREPSRGDIVVFDAPARAQQVTPPPEAPLPPLARAVRGIGRFTGLVPPPTDEFVKRVIGLPGETVHVKDGSVFIDGKLLEEPYLAEGVITTASESMFAFEPIKIKEGEVWVMGDNRPGSSDSRVFGPIRQDTIVGRTFVRVWPFCGPTIHPSAEDIAAPKRCPRSIAFL